MRRIGLTVAATVWVLLVAAGYVWVPVWTGWSALPPTNHGVAPVAAWYGCGWIIAGIVGAIPFVVYSSIDD